MATEKPVVYECAACGQKVKVEKKPEKDPECCGKPMAAKKSGCGCGCSSKKS
jgi:hypothetical protein